MWVRLSACKELLDLKGIHRMSLRVTGKQPEAKMMHVQMVCVSSKNLNDLQMLEILCSIFFYKPG